MEKNYLKEKIEKINKEYEQIILERVFQTNDNQPEMINIKEIIDLEEIVNQATFDVDSKLKEGFASAVQLKDLRWNQENLNDQIGLKINHLLPDDSTGKLGFSFSFYQRSLTTNYWTINILSTSNKAINGFKTKPVESGNKSIVNHPINLLNQINNKNNTNIAITSGNREGKSTVIESLLNNNSDIKNKSITIYLSKYKNYQKDSNDEIDNRIELQIINQIIYQIDSKKIYLSKYKIKKNKSKKHKVGWSIFTTLFIIVLYFLAFCFTEKIEIGKWNTNFNLWIALSLVLVIPFILLNIWFIKTEKLNKISKVVFNFFGSKIESDNLINNSSFDLSLLDTEWREIIYLLSYSEKEYVIFENLNRLNNYDLLTKLKQLNLIINKHIAPKKIIFIYLISNENIFSEKKDKINFFDDVVNLFPVYSEEMKIEFWKFSIENFPKFKVSDVLLYHISRYISDIHAIKMISNEYNTYLKINFTNENFEIEIPEWFNLDKLFSSIVIKYLSYDIYNDIKNFHYDRLLGRPSENFSFNIKDHSREYLSFWINQFSNKEDPEWNELRNYLFVNPYKFLTTNHIEFMNMVNLECSNLNDEVFNKIISFDLKNPDLFLSHHIKNIGLIKNKYLNNDSKYLLYFLNLNIISIIFNFPDTDLKMRIVFNDIISKYKKYDFIWKEFKKKIKNEDWQRKLEENIHFRRLINDLNLN